jgi:uncharacterized membrane protein YphA (DoxX/SURF4 family)
MSSPPTFALRMEQFLDRLHARARSSLLLRYFAAVNRILLAIGFIPTGLVKIRGQRFTTNVDLDSPIGLFFEAMYRTGTYWQFLGWAQVIAGVLLLIPATSTLGAVLFFPAIVNIFLITFSLEFTGTPVLTGGMLLANLFLLCWDWHRLKPLVFAHAVPVSFPAPAAGSPLATSLERAGYVTITVSGLLFFMWTRNMVPRALALPSVGVGLLGGVLLLVSLVLHRRGLRPPAAPAPAA